MHLCSVLVHCGAGGYIYALHGFYNQFVWHDSGISHQIFQLYSLITQKIRNMNKVPFLLEPFYIHLHVHVQCI